MIALASRSLLDLHGHATWGQRGAPCGPYCLHIDSDFDSCLEGARCLSKKETWGRQQDWLAPVLLLLQAIQTQLEPFGSLNSNTDFKDSKINAVIPHAQQGCSRTFLPYRDWEDDTFTFWRHSGNTPNTQLKRWNTLGGADGAERLRQFRIVGSQDRHTCPKSRKLYVHQLSM